MSVNRKVTVPLRRSDKSHRTKGLAPHRVVSNHASGRDGVRRYRQIRLLMCGRFTSSQRREAIAERLQVAVP